MSDQVQEIKQRTDIVEFISQTVPLKRTGKNFRGICPFHKESTPSFFVTADRQSWHCFGCNKGGDVLAFVMEKEGLDFRGALELLATRAGITLTNVASQPKHADVLTRIMESTLEFYESQFASNSAKVAQEYIYKKRQISPEMVKVFHVGYAPDSWDATGKYLQTQGFRPEEIERVGLSIPKDGGRGWYDRFRGRVMFPIYSKLGKVVGFSGRTLEADAKTAKYINSPETELFKKSELLFGYHQAKDEIMKRNYAIVVEGQLDVIALHHIGVHNVVAPLGTALTPMHITQLKRLSQRLMLLFDADTAGQNAALRSLEECLKQSMEVKIVKLTKGKDPDEAFRSDPAQLRRDLAKALPFFTYLIQKTKATYDEKEPLFAMRSSHLILPFIRLISDPVQQEALLQELGREINISVEALQKALAKEGGQVQTTAPQPAAKGKSAPTSREESLWSQLNALVLQTPDHLQDDAQLLETLQSIPPESLHMGPLQTIGHKIIAYVLEHHMVNHAELDALLPDSVNVLNQLTLLDVSTLTQNDDVFLETIERLVDDLTELALNQEITLLPSSMPDRNARLEKLRELTEKKKEIQARRVRSATM